MRQPVRILRISVFGTGIFLVDVFVFFFFPAGRARELTKKIIRKKFIESLEDTREEDIKNFVDTILDEDVQRAIGMQIEKLSKKK